MGKLDEGGSRGECAGLFFLLDDIANTVASMYGSILRSSEGMFAHGKDGGKAGNSSVKHVVPMEVDLVTCGVWVPVATALMADPGIKMAIFSPGIANVLQVCLLFCIFHYSPSFLFVILICRYRISINFRLTIFSLRQTIVHSTRSSPNLQAIS